MKLLLASFLHPDIGDYISGRVLYIDDAASEMRKAPFAQAELKAIGEAAETLVPLTLSQSNSSDLQNEIASANCIYVASGDVFRLLDVLKKTGADRALTEACLLYTSPSPRDVEESRMPSSA